MPKEKWLAWGVCVNPSCGHCGDMDWREDDEKKQYAVCPECDHEISAEEMPESREDREKRMGF